jgi:hypothetical protein
MLSFFNPSQAKKSGRVSGTLILSFLLTASIICECTILYEGMDSGEKDKGPLAVDFSLPQTFVNEQKMVG